MLKVGLIPLDSRPCNTGWLTEFANIAGVKLINYPYEKCGNLLVGASLNDQIKWIEENYMNMDYLVVSADGLCSGGLVQARLGRIDYQVVSEKIAIFKTLKEKNPKLKIYVFDTLMRTSITAYDKESAYYWSKVNEYSLLKGRVHFYNLDEDKQKLAELENTIPPTVLNTYLTARKIKHDLNKLFIEFVEKEYIDYLILLQEDSQPMSIQKIEQSIIADLVTKNPHQNRIKVYNGTDEGGVILLAKAMLEAYKLAPKLKLVLPSSDVLDHIMLFEDRNFSDNLMKMLETLNMSLTSNDDADFILSIYAEYKNKDLNLSSTIKVDPIKDDNYYNFIKTTNHLIKEGKPTCFVDLLFPNGGSDVILDDIDNKNLTCYSAWNTASNSLGSALANIAAYVVGKINNSANYESLNKDYTKERILDDCLYQYISRRKYNEAALKKNINIFNLGEDGEDAIKEMESDLKTISKKYLTDDFTLELPWNRTFEALIKLKKEG
jgi:hypothetical protein